MSDLALFQARTLLRGRFSIAAIAIFAIGAFLVTALGLGSFQQLGLGAVGPAAAALVNLAILLPTIQAMLLGALGTSGDRESGFLAMLRARGVSPAVLLVSSWMAVTISSWLSLLAGFGAAAVLIAGNVPLEDILVFASLLALMLVIAACAAAIGVLIGVLASTRLQAALGAVAVWFILAVGLDLAVIGFGVFLRLGEPAILGAIVMDPFSTGQKAALLLLDQAGAVVGPVGTYLVERLGRIGAIASLVAVVAIWTVAPLALAIRTLGRRDL